MSSVELHSDAGSGGSSGSGPTRLYRCKYCTGQEFTAAERDSHRLTHRNQNETGRGSGRGRNRNRATNSQQRGSSPVGSMITLFEEIVTPPGSEPTRKRKKRGRRHHFTRRSKKNYDLNAANVVNRRYSSG